MLAQLDTERLKLSLAQSEAQSAVQRSTVAKLKAGSRPEEIKQAAAQRDVARVAVLDARQVYQRQLDLVAKHFVSQQQADSAKNNLDGAQQQLKAAEETYRLAVLGPRKEDIAAAEAGLAAQDAAVAGLKHDISEGQLVAPDNGVIENRILEPGDMASPQKSVFTLALTDPVWARVYLPEAALGRVPVGARATITTDSHPDKKYPGLGRLRLAGGGIHAQDGGDDRTAHQPGLPDPRVRLRRPGRTASGHAGDGDHRLRPEGVPGTGSPCLATAEIELMG